MNWLTDLNTAHPILVGWIGGGVVGVILGLLPSVLTGHWGNLLTERRSKKSYEGKLQQFTYELSERFRTYIYSQPKEGEGVKRQEEVTAAVKELSLKHFGQEIPPIKSIRPEHTQYPVMKCKWCHLDHGAENGSVGGCINCAHPLDLWIGIQGEPKK